MNISIFDKQHFRTTDWSGGSTTQLYIFPSDATISERNFEVRLSTASVEVEESTFTALEGVHRKLMALEGEIELSHQGYHTSRLKPFEVDVFSGDWKTSCIGTCVDFNLMTTGDTKSDISSLHLAEKSHSVLKVEDRWKKISLYVYSGSFQIDINEKMYVLEQHELMVMEDLDLFSFPIAALMDCRIVVVKID